MSKQYIYVDCPVCDTQLEIEAELEPEDRSVGINGGLMIPDAPVTCPAEGETYTYEEHHKLQLAIERACETWEPDHPPHDYNPREDAV